MYRYLTEFIFTLFIICGVVTGLKDFRDAQATCRNLDDISSINWEQLDSSLFTTVGVKSNDQLSLYTCDPEILSDFIDLYDACMDGITSSQIHENWSSSSSATADIKLYRQLRAEKQKYLSDKIKLIRHNCFDSLDDINQRKVRLATRGDYDIGDREDEARIGKIRGEMSDIYDYSLMNLTVGGKEYTHLRQEPDMERLMGTDDNEPLWKAAWYEFRNKHSPLLKGRMIEYKNISNTWAKKAGFPSAAHAWTQEFELDLEDYEQLISSIVKEFTPIYRKLHAYVKYILTKKYPELEGQKYIPAHLVKNMWGQRWMDLLDIMVPFKGFRMNIEPKLKEKYGNNFTKLVELSDSYYQSIGFPKLPDTFYERSVFTETQNSGKKVDCHGTAHTMFIPRRDVRVKMCGKVKAESMFTIHHEMGHIHYYLAYRQQPYTFYDGASPAFHEAVGDTIALLATTGFDHLISVGLLDKPDDTTHDAQGRTDRDKMLINQLMHSALEKIPLVFFSFITDKWHFDFYQDKIRDSELNAHWWKLVHKYQGLTPPNMEKRGEEFFDIGAKYHVAHLRFLYTRYQIARVHQFQFLHEICKLSGSISGRHFAECNIDGNTNSTTTFRHMLSKGSSVNWQQQLKELTGDGVNPQVAISFFKPLEQWLDEFLHQHNIPVENWDSD